MRWNVISTLVSFLRAPLRARTFSVLGLSALLGASAALAGCRCAAEGNAPLGCGLTGGPCACAAPACETALPERPPGARPGEVWCKVMVPATYETVFEQIETVCPSVEREWVPPVVETRVVPVVLTPACTEVIRTPGATRLDRMCAEICPERTETRVVVRKDACGCGVKTCETVRIPAVQGMRSREVCVRGPGTQVIRTPEVVSADVCQVEVKPGFWREKAIPGVKETRTRVVCKSPERWEWRLDPSCAAPVVPASPPCAPARPAAAR